jgi:LmbE family N-acetylglucosaminyl deacetylase
LTRGRLRSEDELVPYATSFPPGDRWLVLAPHPDDEVFGLGATLARAVQAGVDVRVVVVTDGAAQGVAADREAEARAAAAVLGLTQPEFWRFADRSLRRDDPRLWDVLREALLRIAPEVVFVTSPVDLHPDHRALALALHAAVRRHLAAGLRTRCPRWVVAYEVGAPLRPNLLVDADPWWDRKKQAVSCYAGQLAVRPYDRVMEGLAAMRSLTLSGVRFAEAFHVTPARRLARITSARWASWMGSTEFVSSRKPDPVPVSPAGDA